MKIAFPGIFFSENKNSQRGKIIENRKRRENGKYWDGKEIGKSMFSNMT